MPKLKYLVIIWLIILLVIAGAIAMWFFTEKKDAIEIIDSYITEKGYEDHIQEKEIAYDWKLGTYFATVTFKDEPDNYYELYPVDRKSTRLNSSHVAISYAVFC